MEKFEIQHAVTLFTTQTTNIISLWTVYVVAAWAAAGYGLSASPLNSIIAGVITIGFSAFTYGHWTLVKQALRTNLSLKKSINAFIDSSATGCDAFKDSLKDLTRTANPFWVSRVAHLVVDICVISAIWSRSDIVASWLQTSARVHC